MTKPARYFVADAAEGRVIPGVPMRDLTEDEYDALSDSDKATVDDAPFFRKTAPQSTGSRKAADKE